MLELKGLHFILSDCFLSICVSFSCTALLKFWIAFKQLKQYLLRLNFLDETRCCSFLAILSLAQAAHGCSEKP